MENHKTPMDFRSHILRFMLSESQIITEYKLSLIEHIINIEPQLVVHFYLNHKLKF